MTDLCVYSRWKMANDGDGKATMKKLLMLLAVVSVTDCLTSTSDSLQVKIQNSNFMNLQKV